jgi:hypothetical protein
MKRLNQFLMCCCCLHLFPFYMKNSHSHQSIQFYTWCTVNGSFNHAFFIGVICRWKSIFRYLQACDGYQILYTISWNRCFPSIFPYQIFYRCLSNKHIQFSFKGNMNISIELLCLLNQWMMMMAIQNQKHIDCSL